MVKNMSASRRGASSAVLILILVAGLIGGALISSYILMRRITTLENDISNLESEVSQISGNQTVYNQNVTIYQNATALSELYAHVKDSVVLISGTTSSGTVQGSGFIYNYTGSMVIVTNNHVVHGATGISVTFSDGDGFAASVNGTDPYADLAVLTVSGTSPSDFKPLQIVRSDTLKVGDPVVAIGAPFGLVGSLTSRLVSALGRTISEQEYTGGFAIANIIQTSTAINPGNSGGPLLNFNGNVVGITAAIVANSQGLGFAVPSNAIINEIFSLVTTGSYNGHPYVGVSGGDMDFNQAQSMHASVTYGWRIGQVTSGGPAAGAGVHIDDIIIGINGTRITNGDEMSSYLEEKAVAGQTVVLNISRGGQTLNLTLVLGTRPPPPA